MYRIKLTTQIQRIKDGTKTVWETVETSKKYITDEQHENLTNTDTLRFFKSVGYREYTEKSHTFAGYKITQLVSTNPNKSKRKIRSFEFEHLTLEQWHNWQVDEFSTYHPNQFPQGWEQWIIVKCGSRDIERINKTLDELVTIFAESLGYEIFHVAEQTINSENEEVFCEGEGYYCWHCLPGCLPDNEAHYLGNEKRESLHMFMTYFVPLEFEWDYKSMSILDPTKVVTQDNSTTTKANTDDIEVL